MACKMIGCHILFYWSADRWARNLHFRPNFTTHHVSLAHTILLPRLALLLSPSAPSPLPSLSFYVTSKEPFLGLTLTLCPSEFSDFFSLGPLSSRPSVLRLCLPCVQDAVSSLRSRSVLALFRVHALFLCLSCPSPLFHTRHTRHHTTR